MLDLQAITQRASAKVAATPANAANPANPLTTDDEAISKLAELAGLAVEDGGASEAATPANAANPANPLTTDDDEAISKLAALAGLAADERVTCGQCRHFAPKARLCRNHKRAGLRSAQLGLDLPTLPQRCPGFVSGPPVACTKVGPFAAPFFPVTGHFLRGQT